MPTPLRSIALIVLTIVVAAACAQRPASQAPAPAEPSTPLPDAGVYALIPRPSTVTPHAGRFDITPQTVIWTDAGSAGVGHQLARYLEPATGFRFAARTGGSPPARAMVLRLDPSLARLGSEGYTLDIRTDGVTARAAEPAGLFYAVQTIRQLLPPEIFREAPVRDIA